MFKRQRFPKVLMYLLISLVALIVSTVTEKSKARVRRLQACGGAARAAVPTGGDTSCRGESGAQAQVTGAPGQGRGEGTLPLRACSLVMRIKRAGCKRKRLVLLLHFLFYRLDPLYYHLSSSLPSSSRTLLLS